jgi:hypothetical protein
VYRNEHTQENAVKTGPNKRLAVLRESIGKTVRMFVEQGITVTQRGTQPFVMWNPHTCKAQRINMPMIPENAELELLEALQGFLDHECAHVFFTPPEKQMAVANAGKRAMLPMMNMIEDIRIEKLLPRKFPGTAANLSRMRSGAFGTILKNICQKALAMPQPQQAMSMMVPAFRSAGDAAADGRGWFLAKRSAPDRQAAQPRASPSDDGDLR